MANSASPWVVRPARRDDLPTLKKIWLELMHMHESNDTNFALAKDGVQKWAQMTDDMLERDDTFVLVAVRSTPATVAGFCLGWVARNPPIYRVSEVGFVSEIAVTKTAQRSGAGRALIEASRRWFADRNLVEFQLSTAVWNESAQKFWRSVGGAPLLVRYRFDVNP